LVVRRPSELVASCWYAPPAYEPRRIPAALGFEMPVPPPPAVRVPLKLGAKVCVSLLEVIVSPRVRPLNDAEEVASTCVAPV